MTRLQALEQVARAAKYLINYEGCKTLLEKNGVTPELMKDKLWTGQSLFEALEALSAFRSAPVECWQDISSAPKDGTLILAGDPGGICVEVHWAQAECKTCFGEGPDACAESHEFHWMRDYDHDSWIDPTLWMPRPLIEIRNLPPPPATHPKEG